MQKPPSSKGSLRGSIEAILSSKKLTLHRVSQLSASLYGRTSEYFIPHNFYYELTRGRFTPSIYQLAALSRITGYRLCDWLLIFGLNLEEISKLQVLLPAKRTILLDSALVDPRPMTGRLHNKPGLRHIPEIAPLTQLLEIAGTQSGGPPPQKSGERFLYAKIGVEDALAFPELIPGSIVRADPRIEGELLSKNSGEGSRRIFLVEHSKGLFCCRLRAAGRRLWIPISAKLPYAQVEFQHPSHARILGVIDLEVRPLVKLNYPEVPVDLARRWKPATLEKLTRFARLVRDGRARMNLSLHQASALSRTIAELLSDARYFISASSLSDYEIAELPPRHIHKAMTLCVLYGLEFRSFLRAVGISLEEMDLLAIPDHLTGRQTHSGTTRERRPAVNNGEVGFLEELDATIGALPFFLARSIRDLSGLPDPSFEDFFWVGGEKNPLHPHLINALVAVVNRRKKKPIHYRMKPIWEQPIYVLLLRSGRYLCACASVEDRNLILHPYPQYSHRPFQFRYPDEAEVVGQISTIVRRFL